MSVTTVEATVEVAEPITREFQVRNVPAWEAKVIKANSRAIRAGLAPAYTLTVVSEVACKTTTPFGVKIEWTEWLIRIDGDAPSLPGWRFAATLDWDTTEPVVRTSPLWSGDALPRPASQVCDHCGTKRHRNNTYLVHSATEGFKQVGAQCLTAYTGIPVGWVATADSFSEDDEERGFNSGSFRYYETRSLLRMTIALVDARGYTKGRETGSTRDDFDILWYGRQGKYGQERKRLLHDQLAKRTRDDASVEAEIDAILTWATTLKGSDYADNLRVILAEDTVSDRSSGYAISAVASHRRDLERTVERAAKKAAEPARTPVVEGRQDIVGTILSLKVIESQYGETTKIRLRTEAGSVLWGTLPRALDVAGDIVGQRVAFTATVERSNDDPGFGFYARPTKARYLDSVVVEGEDSTGYPALVLQAL